MPTALALPANDSLHIKPWPDPVIDQVGHDPRSAYVEHFWLGILGPASRTVVQEGRPFLQVSSYLVFKRPGR